MALVVFAIVLPALLPTLSQQLDGLRYLDDRAQAQWVAATVSQDHVWCWKRRAHFRAAQRQVASRWPGGLVLVERGHLDPVPGFLL